MLVVLMAVTTMGLAITAAAPVEAQGSAALSIPPRKNYTIEPGSEINDTLRITNADRERPLYLNFRIVDFTYSDDGGTPKLDLSEDSPQTTWSLRSFMEVPQTVTIEPGQSASVPMSVAVPANQGAGSYYSAIISSSGSSDGGNVGLSASGVTLVFVTVPGEMHEKLTLTKLGAFDSAERKYKFFNMDMPHRIGYTLKNDGNVAESPVGSMTIKNIFGQEKTINDINPNRSLALIGQERTFETCVLLAKQQLDFNGSRQEASTCVSPGLWPGFYTVKLHGFYGQNGNNTQELMGKGYFIYTPWWFIAILIVLLLLIAYHGWRFSRYIRGKKGGSKPSRAPRAKK